MSFPCPGDRFLPSYVNLLLCTDCSCRPFWKWVEGLCCMIPYIVLVHFSTSFLCFHSIVLGLSPGARTGFLVPEKCCLPLHGLQSHPNPLPPELPVILVSIHQKLIIPLNLKSHITNGKCCKHFSNHSSIDAKDCGHSVVIETGTIPPVNG